MRIPLQRIVVDVEIVLPDLLRPIEGAMAHREPARREGALHRDLARLADATSGRIVSFASTHGLLRRRTDWVRAVATAEARGPILAMGHRMLDDLAALRTWVEAGAVGEPPDGVRAVGAIVAAFAELPEPILQGAALAASGAADAQVEAAIGDQAIDSADFFARLGGLAAPLLDGRRSIASVPRPKLLLAIDGLECAARLLGGLDEPATEVEAMGGVPEILWSMIANQPEAFLHPALVNQDNADSLRFIEELADETLDDWRQVARALAVRNADVRVLHRALGTEGVDRAEQARLAELYVALAGFDPPSALTAVELAERLLPLYRAAVEAGLMAEGTWPVRRGATVGLYGRAMLALWTELTEAPVLVMCATEGCAGRFVLTRHRTYCDRCQADRKRDSVRRSRANAGPATRADVNWGP